MLSKPLVHYTSPRDSTLQRIGFSQFGVHSGVENYAPINGYPHPVSGRAYGIKGNLAQNTCIYAT